MKDRNTSQISDNL